MIYEIRGVDIVKINQADTFIVAHSVDGCSILVNCSTVLPVNIEILNAVGESELTLLLQEPFWKQPCINC